MSATEDGSPRLIDTVNSRQSASHEGSVQRDSRPPDAIGTRENLSAEDPQQSQKPHVSQARKFFSSLVIVLVATLSMIVDVGLASSTTVMLPTIGREFDAGPSQLQWVLSSYTLSSGCLLLLGGRLSDLYGQKRVYLAGTLILTGLSLGCGFAKDIITLIVLRAIQGIGVAAAIPASMGILALAFPPGRTRSFAFATFSSGSALGAVIGSAVAGALTEQTAYTLVAFNHVFLRWCKLSCFLGGGFCIDNDDLERGEDKRVDWIGAFLVTAGLVMILFILGDGESAPHKWSTNYIIALLVVGVFSIAVFIWWQRFLEDVQENRSARSEPEEITNERGVQEQTRSWRDSLPPPLMKLSIWTRGKGRFSAVMVIVFCAAAAFTGWITWVQLYYQDYVGLSALESVKYQIPMFVAGIMTNTFVGIMAARIPMIALTSLGTLGTAGACMLFALINPKATYWAFSFPAMVLGPIGIDFVFVSGTLYVSRIAGLSEQSVAGATLYTMAQLGFSAGVTIPTVVFDRISSSLSPGEDNLRSYRSAHWTCTAFALLASVLSLLVFRGVGVPGGKEPVAAQPDAKPEENEKRGEEVEGP